MKRLISFLVVITMLVGLGITTSVSASAPTYTTYTLNSADFINSSVTADGFSNYLPYLNKSLSGAVRDIASNPNGRYGEEVYAVTNNSDFIIGVQDANVKDVRFNDGDIIHITTEMMIPAGKVTMGRYTDYKAGIVLSPLFGTKTGDTYDVATSLTGGNDNGIRVSNRGKKDRYIYANNMIVGMDMENQHFSLFGNVNTKETWEYDKWYRFDVVLTMGANPTASIYVNGNPFTVEPDKVPKEPTEEDPLDYEGRHYDNMDATFDGIHTISENVAIGTWLNDGAGEGEEFVKYGLYGINSAILARAQYDAESTIYIGDLIYRSLPAGSDVELPEALTLFGVKDGGFFDPADLTAVEVQVPEFIKHKIASVELAVDGNVITGNDGVYDLSNIGGGSKTIALTAKDAEGKELRASSMEINLPAENDIHGLDAITFGGADDAARGNFWFVDQGEGFYWGSNPRNIGDHKDGFRVITAPGGPAGADDYYAKMERDDSVANTTASTPLRLAYRYNTAYAGSSAGEAKVWKDGIVHVSYDLLLPAHGVDGNDWLPTGGAYGNDWDTTFTMSIGTAYRTTNTFLNPAVGNGFTFEGTISGRGATVPLTVGSWGHLDWKLDYVNRTIELTVDGKPILNDKADSPYLGTSTLEMSDAFANAGFEGVSFDWFGKKGSVGIDNLEVKYELVKPYVKSVDFGDGKSQGRKVLTSATTAAVEIPGKVFSIDGSANMASFVSLVDGDGVAVANAPVSMAADGKTVNIDLTNAGLVAGEDYRIKIAGNIPLGREGNTQLGTDIGDYTIKTADINAAYTFTAVDSFDSGEGDDGVDGVINVNDVRFTTHAHRVDVKPLTGYAGEGLSREYKLRADMKVTNSSDSAQTIAMVVATYAGNELVNVAIGGDRVVPANAKNITITSAPIVIGENTDLTAKVFMLDSLGNLKPLSYAYDIFGNVAE